MNEAFERTLTLGQRHLARRLESFGDVVFGFTISQLALQFALPVVPHDLVAHWPSYGIYAITFGAIALLWLSYHRMLSSHYVPTPVDLSVAFVFLGFTGLVPYAMYAFLHFANSLDGVRYGYGAYMICAIGTLGTAMIIRWRNYIRGAEYLEPIERLRTFRRLVINSTLIPLFLVVLALDVNGELQVASFLFLFIPVASVLGRRLITTAPLLRRPAVTEATA